MDEPWLSELLERATAGEPPIGPVARNSLRAGIRRRRRVQGSAACAAGVAVICAAVLAVTGASGTPGAATGTIPQTVYVLSMNGTVTPISTATNTPGEPIAAGPAPRFMALTPNGQTLYVADGTDTVTPIATATNTPGKPIKVGQDPSQILFTPDGQTAYVATYSGVTPISTATNTPEKPIAGTGTGVGGPDVMALTPDGKTLYVASGNTAVIPVSTATNTPGKPIQVGDQASPQDDQMIITPDGSTLYVFSINGVVNLSGVITPVSTATNTPGQPIPVVANLSFAMAMTPDGNTLYVAAGNGQDVVPVSTATNTPGPPISVAGTLPYDIAVTPDGQTAYVASQPGCRIQGRSLPPNCGLLEVTPISTATNTPGTPVKVTGGNLLMGGFAITPDGKTIYIISGDDSTVTPITTATNTPGQPINVAGRAQSIVITP